MKYGGDASGVEDFPLQWYLPVTGGDPANAATTGTGSSTGTGPGAAGNSVLERAITEGGGAAGGGGKDSTGSTDGGGAEPLKEMFSIVGGGLKETLGIGLWPPDFAGFPAINAIETLMGAVVPMASAYASGEWQPRGLLGQALGTSSAPVGIPNVEAPPMPANGVHTGSGALAGPVQNITWDQSQNFNNFPLGWTPRKSTLTTPATLRCGQSRESRRAMSPLAVIACSSCCCVNSIARSRPAWLSAKPPTLSPGSAVDWRGTLGTRRPLPKRIKRILVLSEVGEN